MDIFITFLASFYCSSGASLLLRHGHLCPWFGIFVMVSAGWLQIGIKYLSRKKVSKLERLVHLCTFCSFPCILVIFVLISASLSLLQGWLQSGDNYLSKEKVLAQRRSKVNAFLHFYPLQNYLSCIFAFFIVDQDQFYCKDKGLIIPQF